MIDVIYKSSPIYSIWLVYRTEKDQSWRIVVKSTVYFLSNITVCQPAQLFTLIQKEIPQSTSHFHCCFPLKPLDPFLLSSALRVRLVSPAHLNWNPFFVLSNLTFCSVYESFRMQKSDIFFHEGVLGSKRLICTWKHLFSILLRLLVVLFWAFYNHQPKQTFVLKIMRQLLPVGCFSVNLL